jgi:hypothetical protein
MGHNRAICLQAPNARFGWIAILRRDPLGRLSCAVSGYSRPRPGTGKFDPNRTFSSHHQMTPPNPQEAFSSYGARRRVAVILLACPPYAGQRNRWFRTNRGPSAWPP